jgi:hypothetical protein
MADWTGKDRIRMTSMKRAHWGKRRCAAPGSMTKTRTS